MIGSQMGKEESLFSYYWGKYVCKARLQCGAYYEKLQKAVIHNKTTIGEKKGKAKQRIRREVVSSIRWRG